MDPIVFIPLTQGYVAVIDFDDFEKVRGQKWCAHKVGRRIYAARNLSSPGKGQTTWHLHHFLMGEKHVDHRDGDGLNNLRSNLRTSNNQKNHWAFMRKRAGATSKFRGVSWSSRNRKWAAYIHRDGRTVNLGLFSGESVAAKAYDSAARRLFGDFASLNFP